MSDLISRQALKQALGIDADDCDKCSWGHNYGRCRRGGDFEDACCAIDDAPSAEPEETIQKIQDMEQAQLQKAYELGKQDALKEIVAENMDVIRCKDCKYSQLTYDGQCKYCEQWEDDEGYLIELRLDGDFYCGYAERREDD